VSFTDADLIARVLSREDQHAFGELVRRYQSPVRAFLARLARGDAHLADDLAQETFLKAWRALGQFDGRAPFEHWISRIAVHTALDHLRREKRHKNEIGFPDLGEDALDWLRSPEEKNELAARDAAEVLHRALDQLAPADRVVITMQELEGRSVKEIAAVLGVSGIAVRVRAVRARAKLKHALERLSEP
jgi:RNA polymerase sigma-70 factor (ECF subfamily)